MVTNWRLSAVCKPTDVDLFFPSASGDNFYGEAKRICATCPVQAECLDYAIRNDIDEGMWGGRTVNERRAIVAGAIYGPLLAEVHGDAKGTPRGYYRHKRAGQIPCTECHQAFNAHQWAAEKARKARKLSA